MGEKIENQIIEESDVGSADILDLGATVEPVDTAPTGEVEKEAEMEEEKIDWAPLENDKIEGVLDHLAESLLKIKGVEMYRNPGKSDYFGFRTKKSRGVAFLYLSAKSARLSLGEVERVNGRMRGSFPKHLIFRVEEGGLVRDGEKTKTAQIVKHVRGYIKDRSW